MSNKKVIEFLEFIAEHPYSVTNENKYGSISDFLNGYVFGLSVFDETYVNFNVEFSLWLNKSKNPSSLYWTSYIFHILADGDDELACKLIFEKMIEFIGERKEL